MRILLLLLLALSVSSSLFVSKSYGQVYKWKDADGKVHYSDKKPVSDKENKAEKIELKINTYKNVTVEIFSEDVGPKVVMYSTEWCGYCKVARRYFKKNNIPFIEYDIEKNKKANRRYKKLGATGVPVILVGNKRMNGFNEERFARLYSKN